MASVQTTVGTHHWTRTEYDRMVDAGAFHPELRLELAEGRIVDVTPQSSRHALSVGLADNELRGVVGDGYVIRTQMPLALGTYSEPEPDVAVVRGTLRQFRDEHPHQAALVVEVADHSLQYDREDKLHIYARNSIPEYWIVNLVDGCVEVYRRPAGDTYESRETLGAAESLHSQTFPGGTIRVEYLLP